MDKPPSLKTRWGAEPDDWALLDLTIGIGTDLLPVVSNPNATISPSSSIKQLGKTPSRYNRDRQVVGIQQWTQHRASDAEIARWSSEPDYGICIQTRTVKAFDLDISDSAQVEHILDAIEAITGAAPIRYRRNTAKCLLVFRCEESFPKRVLKTAHGLIELLSTGQQFIAFGTHTSGERYRWNDTPLASAPVLTLEQVDEVWQLLEDRFAVEPSRSAKTSASFPPGEHVETDDPVADWLTANGHVISETRRGGLVIACPWEDEHSGGETGDTSTVWFRAGTGGHSTGHFRCQHAHCEHRNRSDFLAKIGYQENVADDFEDLGPDPEQSEGFEHGEEGPETDGASSSPFKLVPIGEFAQQPTGGWIVKKLIPWAELGIIYGASGSGKTFIILDIALSVARGIPWRGLRVRQGRVVYIVAEGSGGFRHRARAYAQQHGVDLKDIDLLVLDAAPNLLDVKQVKALGKAIEAAGPVSMIIVDTFAQATPGANENAAEDMGKAIGHVRHVGRKVGAVVVLVHHAGKDAAKGARGWSGLRAAADFELEVTRDGENRTLNTTKQKDADDSQQWAFRLQEIVIGIDSDGDEITSCIVADGEVVVAAGVKGGGARKAAGKSQAPLGPNEKIVMDTVQELLVGGGDVRLLDLIAEAWPRLPEGSERARKKAVNRAIGTLVKRGRLDKDEFYVFVT